MEIFKKTIITLITSLFTIMIIYGGYTIYAEGEEQDFSGFTMFAGQPFLFLLSSAYHDSMNDFFNYKIQRAVALIDSNAKFYADKDFLVPEFVNTTGSTLTDEIKEKCKTNISTYCVSMEALDLYIKYLESLNIMKGNLPAFEPNSTIEEVLNNMESRDDDIEEDMKDAKLVMEATVNAYNEFKSAYPMHKQYRTIINNLTKYKIALMKIRKETKYFPLRFIDSTSSQCK